MEENILINKPAEKIKGRIKYIDIAKGIVILLVVYGHTVTYKDIPFTIIFSFHMPFFFFISGWLNSFSDKQADFGKYFINSFKKLIIPSLIFRTLRFWNPTDIKAWLTSIFLDPYSEWFLMTMFAAGILFYFFKKYDAAIKNIYIRICFTLLLVGITPLFGALYIYWGLHMKVGVPFSFDCVLTAFSFMVIGYYANKLIQKYKIPKMNIWAVIALVIVGAIVIRLILINSYVNICDSMFGTSHTFFYFAAVFMTGIIMGVSHLFEKSESKSKLLRGFNSLLCLYGRNSLWIYICHILMFDLYGKYIAEHNIVLNHSLSIFLYIIVTLAILTPVFVIEEYIKKKIKSRK